MNTVLVVDDSPFIVDLFIRMLERGGYRALKAYSGQECLNLLKSEKPQIILLDIMMDPMDGWQVLERIKNDPDTRNIPVFILTAKLVTFEEIQKYGKFFAGYLMKPITHRDLYDSIEGVLRGTASTSDSKAEKIANYQHEIEKSPKKPKPPKIKDWEDKTP